MWADKLLQKMFTWSALAVLLNYSVYLFFPQLISEWEKNKYISKSIVFFLLSPEATCLFIEAGDHYTIVISILTNKLIELEAVRSFAHDCSGLF